jgi:5-methylcytosine-specific restriction protein A
MSLEDDLTAALIDGYQRAGTEVGYWGRRFLQAVRRNGGLATVKRMMEPRNAGQRAGLDALLEANRPDLTVEAIILQPKYRTLFTAVELSIAAERLGEYGKAAAKQLASRDRLFPDEPEPDRKYVEGARRQVRVNAYERDPRARKACLKAHGLDCTVCGLNFEARYGALGKGFIHVHHLRPLALTGGEYELNPVADLRPVCPNCHAMLHRQEQTLSIEELRTTLETGAFFSR